MAHALVMRIVPPDGSYDARVEHVTHLMRTMPDRMRAAVTRRPCRGRPPPVANTFAS